MSAACVTVSMPDRPDAAYRRAMCPRPGEPFRRPWDKTPTGTVQKVPLGEAGITAATWDHESIGYVVRR